MKLYGTRSLPPLRPIAPGVDLGAIPESEPLEDPTNYWVCLDCHLFSLLGGNTTSCRFDHANEGYHRKIQKLTRLIIRRDRFCVMETPATIKTELTALDHEFKRVRTMINNSNYEHSTIHQGTVLIPWEFPLWLGQLEQFLDMQIGDFSDEANFRSVGDDQVCPFNFPWIQMRLVEFRRKMQAATPQLEIVFRPDTQLGDPML